MKLAAVVLSLLGVCAGGSACTIFKLTHGQVTLVGNSEDFYDSNTRVWFLPPEGGKHGRVYFGFRNGLAQGGMNDAGLFFDWVTTLPSPDAKLGTPVRPWARTPDRQDFLGSLSEKILEEATTVDEAIQVYRR